METNAQEKGKEQEQNLPEATPTTEDPEWGRLRLDNPDGSNIIPEQDGCGD